MRRVLIANRGEIALRIIRACRKAGLGSVAVYSEADKESPHIWAADRAICVGPAPAAQSYLAADTLVAAALGSGCDAVHPGYGFLAENAGFAAKCLESGLIFVGPSAETISLMGDKVAARRTAAGYGIPVVPGSDRGFADVSAAESEARRIGFPLLLKASAGGGGRGMRVADSADAFAPMFLQANKEAEAAFGDGRIYLERFLGRVRHIEVQIFGDSHGAYVHLGERDCSVQRRHQKLVEEAPSPVLEPGQRREICDAAVAIAEGIGYVNAGTVEFLFDVASGKFYFMEMNTRIQVEHPVTEALTGTDLVFEQLRVAAGKPLDLAPKAPIGCGHAIEWRINAEDPARGFLPTPGRVSLWRPPTGPGIRFDSHVYEGYTLAPFYDSLLGKLIVSGRDRAEAIRRSASALAGFRVAGIATTIPFHRSLVGRAEFIRGEVHTRWVEHEMGH